MHVFLVNHHQHVDMPFAFIFRRTVVIGRISMMTTPRFCIRSCEDDESDRGSTDMAAAAAAVPGADGQRAWRAVDDGRAAELDPQR